jgi:trk system potassium uptake protein
MSARSGGAENAERRPRRRRWWRSSRSRLLRRLVYIIGMVIAASGATMLPAALVSAAYSEWHQALGIAAAAGVTIGAGLLAWRWLGLPGEFTTREGFASVGLSWFVMSAFGALPYLLTGAIGNVTDAFFETAAGFTTTGSSVVPDPATLSHGILIWRATTQWVGGMGIIVLSIAILPLLGAGGVELARAESPGPTPARLTPRFRDTAKRLWWVYVGLTLLLILLLVAGDMNLFQSVAHALTTMPTGGFSTDAGSIGAFSAYSQWVIIVFMFLAGISFALHYRALRDPGVYARSGEFRLYALITAVVIALVLIGLWDTGFERNFGPEGADGIIRGAVFTAVSILTTTGYATEDFGAWVSGLQILIVGLMFLGGMAGSTAGGVKTFRIGVLTRSASGEVRSLVHPRGIFVTRFDGKAVLQEIVRNVQSFFLFYMFIFMAGTFLMGVIVSRLATEIDLVTSASAVASALGNIGPGLGDVGPTDNYLALPGTAKWLLSTLMIVGRLEIFPILLLLTPDLWRR